MSGQYCENGRRAFLNGGTALAKYTRVKLSSGTLTTAVLADKEIGVLMERVEADASWSLSTHDLACEHVSVGLHLKVTGQVQVKTLKPGFGVVRAPGWSPRSPAATDQASPIPA